MSNGDTQVDVASEGTYHLELAIKLATVYHTGPDHGIGKKAGCSHWRADGCKIYFGWHDSMEGNAFPARMSTEMMVPMILAWLKEQDYPREPDIDGHCTRGWRLTSHIPYEVKGHFYIDFSVEPNWCEYGK